ncbi:MAG: 2OG-Fe dioxygenase family protein [Paracoccaceae bacterium]
MQLDTHSLPKTHHEPIDPFIAGVWPIELSLSQRHHWIGNYFEDIGLPDGLMDHWDDFADSWNDLEQDQFMADGGRYRSRRFTEFYYDNAVAELHAQKHRPFYQSADINTLNGGVDRKFAPITPFIANHPITAAMIRQHATIFSELTGRNRWAINFHQVRITANDGIAGKPAPEGLHKDGVTYTTLFCVKRRNVAGAENLMFDNNKEPLFSTTLTKTSDIIIFEDAAFYHDVTPITPAHPEESAERDMLFIEFTCC